MRMKREIKIKLPESYNELAEYVNNKDVVIYITGTLYDEMLSTARDSKVSRINKVMGGILFVSGILTGGTLTLVVSFLAYLTGISDKDFNEYKIKINKKDRRIELYLKKGEKKFDSHYDTAVY